MTSSIFLDAPWEREDNNAYIARGGYSCAPAHSSGELLAVLRDADLRGRGGAAFPTATKLEAVLAAAPPARPVLVANGAEGEPFSFKDRYLMRYRPHRVLEGLICCAAAVAADQAFVYTCDDRSAESLRAALRERDYPIPVSVVTSEHTYVAGEETAVVNRLSGGLGLPTDKPPRPFESGVHGRPTVVLNVDTLAQVAGLVHPTAAEDGTPASFLASVVSIAGEPALYELPEGTSVRELARDFAGQEATFSAVVMGGFFGGMVPLTDENQVALQFVPPPGSDTALGCASFFFVDEAQDCPVAAAADAAAYLSRHNARQCGPCVRGTATAAKALESLCTGKAAESIRDDFARWAEILPGRGACAVPDGVARLLRCLMTAFAPVVQTHLAGRCERCVDLTASGRRRSRFALTF
ncbi:NADH-ubiquinone oxidoreductase-F iron-sulfur binding region domain-containing protein [Pseudonocardia acidicola]|uniref:Fe-S-binding domain-containing protein n=1 Tax=Pseudonocardia acidicola TaxID=2724939 RepID=A0ABX1SNK7_9PSEU|nr:NADH-ubiquinone oxidoreductase-F iron-sulfur binding region domain-containing protein [Pseudonocardia acidicola]NMI01870.1 Fe-S-binding domain-containing protein [Pseudonocardia acidicola]